MMPLPRNTAFIDRLQPAPRAGGFAMPDHWVWCGSVIRGPDGRYHMFASRWSRRYTFYAGYIYTSEIVRAESATPIGPYEFREVVLPARGPAWWDGRMTHNPTIHRRGNEYLLFYIGATYPGDTPQPDAQGKVCTPVSIVDVYRTIRIGVATAPSLLGPWRRPDAPILAPRDESHWDHSVATNPAPCIRDDGRIVMLYRSHNCQIGLATAEAAEGPYQRLDRPVLGATENDRIEDPYLWWNGSGFEMLAKDLTPDGRLSGEKHAGVHATSPDAIVWRYSSPAKAYSRRVRWEDGTETVQGCLERPQLLIENGTPTHLFAATGDGPGGFDHCSRTWNLARQIGE